MKTGILILLITGFWAVAGNRVGNGGDVVFCKDTNSWELLDFHEARLNSVKLEVSDKLDPWEIAKDRLKPLETLAPKLYRQYSRRLESMRSDVEFKDHVKLTNIKDSLHTFVKKGCNVQQAALGLGFSMGNDKKAFVVSSDLWKKLSANEQAGLLMHELFYEHFFKLGIKNSRPVRQFVSLMFSSKINELTRPDFWAKVNKWDVPIYP